MSEARTAGFFTLGVPPERFHLPHPRLGLPVILLIRRVLIRALEILRQENSGITKAGEDDVTAALRSIIESRLRQSGEVPGFNKRTYEIVIRQGQFANFDGTRLGKEPDLFFKLRDDDNHREDVLSEFDALFVECKPVDAKHPAGSKYCDDGLIRFVRGDYAWAMQEGMMLAFARDGRTIAKHLLPTMSEPARMKSLHTLELPTAATCSMATASAEAIRISRHKRPFPWLHGKGPATEITIYHLWHDCG